MSIDLIQADRNRVVGVIWAYLDRKVPDTVVYTAVHNSPFRSGELAGLLTEAEREARNVDVKIKRMLMLDLRAGLKDRLLLS